MCVLRTDNTELALTCSSRKHTDAVPDSNTVSQWLCEEYFRSESFYNQAFGCFRWRWFNGCAPKLHDIDLNLSVQSNAPSLHCKQTSITQYLTVCPATSGFRVID